MAEKEKIKSDKTLVNLAFLRVMNDPEYFTQWQYDFINDVQEKFECGQYWSLSPKMRVQVEKILHDNS